MSELLWKYMEERLQQKGYLPVIGRHGPVITISREAGCSANQIAGLVLQQIKSTHHDKDKHGWRIINKEIVQLAAKELEVTPDKIQYVFKAEEKKLLDEMLAALSSRYYKSDTVIRKTIMKVIKSIIDDGFVIMVGRGGVAFTKGRVNAVNVMLHAPLEWRVDNICRKYGTEKKKAGEMVKITDHERKLLIEHFYGSKTDYTIYDAVFNASTLSAEQIAGTIFALVWEKQMI
ncbi:MAG: cytidylate kinase-like family protein [Bacteroidetes bacterium]|nr:cytidylate kinase-like family protein [Bacteroidota bacterium]